MNVVRAKMQNNTASIAGARFHAIGRQLATDFVFCGKS